MKEDDITAYLQQFSLEQLDEIRQLVDKKADEKKRQLEEKLRKQQEPMRRTGGMPPSPPKDIAALAEAADLDISGLMRDIDRRKR